MSTKISTELRLTLAFGARQGMAEVGGTGRWWLSRGCWVLGLCWCCILNLAWILHRIIFMCLVHTVRFLERQRRVSAREDLEPTPLLSMKWPFSTGVVLSWPAGKEEAGGLQVSGGGRQHGLPGPWRDAPGAQPTPFRGDRELAGPSTPCPFPSAGLGALVRNQLAINVSISVWTLGSASLTVCLSFLPLL